MTKRMPSASVVVLGFGISGLAKVGALTLAISNLLPSIALRKKPSLV